MIEASHLQKTFGTFQAVNDISLSVKEGELVALLGPNGAGKTTTVRMLAAILQPTSGFARISGFDVVENPEQVRRHVGLLTEFPGLYLRMKPLEYLTFFGQLQGLTARQCVERSEQLLKRFDLWHARNKRLDAFSKGMKQKIALLRALIHEPPVLYLDEPTTAMDPHSARVVRDAIGELRAARRTVLLTTHNLAEAEDLADRIVVIFGGRIVAQGTIAELTEQLMGDPVWELKLGTENTTAATLVEEFAPITERGPNWVRYRTANGNQINPDIVARLTANGVPIISLAEQARRLEDVYLNIVGEHHAERGNWTASPVPAQENDQLEEVAP